MNSQTTTMQTISDLSCLPKKTGATDNIQYEWTKQLYDRKNFLSEIKIGSVLKQHGNFEKVTNIYIK